MELLKLTAKRMLFNKLTLILLFLFFILVLMDSFLYLTTLAYTPETGYAFPHALEVFITRHDESTSILPLFLPFFVLGIAGDYFYTDKSSGMMTLSTLRVGRRHQLIVNILNTSFITASLIGLLYLVLLLAYLFIYPLQENSIIHTYLVEGQFADLPLYAFSLILANILAAIAFQLTGQAVGMVVSKKSQLYIALFLIIFAIPYTLYYALDPRQFPIFNYTPIIFLLQTLQLPDNIFQIFIYWLAYIAVDLLVIFTLFHYNYLPSPKEEASHVR